MRKLTALLLFIFVSGVLFAQEKMNLEMINKIKEEGTKNSKVMDIAFQLTDVNGPRLAGSPGYNKAANWAKTELSKWGLTNAALEPWGEFGKGWELQKSYIAMAAPYYKPMIAYPKTWTKGTKGLQSAEVLLIEATDSAGLEKYKGKLKNKVIVLYRNDTLKHSFTADAKRYTDEELDKMANAQPQQARGQNQPVDTAQQRRMREMQRLRMAGNITTKVKELAEKEGAVAMLSMSPRGHDGTLFAQGGGAYAVGSPDNFLDIMVTMEDYGTICRLAKAGIPVKLDVDVKTAFNQKDTKGYNVIAEIKGTDPSLKEEIVMLGGHLDSWQAATGATDNAAGCAVMMEAVRILKTLNVQPRRTIRIALWGGEEQGLLGSRGYVKIILLTPLQWS